MSIKFRTQGELPDLGPRAKAERAQKLQKAQTFQECKAHSLDFLFKGHVLVGGIYFRWYLFAIILGGKGHVLFNLFEVIIFFNVIQYFL